MTTTKKTTILDSSKLLGHTSAAKVGDKGPAAKSGTQVQAKVGTKVGVKPVNKI